MLVGVCCCCFLFCFVLLYSVRRYFFPLCLVCSVMVCVCFCLLLFFLFVCRVVFMCLWPLRVFLLLFSYVSADSVCFIACFSVVLYHPSLSDSHFPFFSFSFLPFPHFYFYLFFCFPTFFLYFSPACCCFRSLSLFLFLIYRFLGFSHRSV